jgi:hypothetical protein
MKPTAAIRKIRGVFLNNTKFPSKAPRSDVLNLEVLPERKELHVAISGTEDEVLDLAVLHTLNATATRR